MASRLKILLMPPGRGIVPPFDQATPPDPSSMALVIMTGLWEERKSDHDFKGRIRSLSTLHAQQGSAYRIATHCLAGKLLERLLHHPRAMSKMAKLCAVVIARALDVAQYSEWFACIFPT